MRAAYSTICLVVIIATGLHAQIVEIKHTNFKKADSIAALYHKHSLQDLRSLSNKLISPLSTEEEKFRAIYRWVCDNIEYDYSLFVLNQRKRQKLTTEEGRSAWNRKFSVRVFKTLLTHQRTVCTGYAYLVKELATYAGLSCLVIDGYGRTAQSNIGGSGTANHSWNAIQLNNKWYLCDPTWSSGAYDTQGSRFVKKFDDGYFLSDPALFIRNHYPLDTAWTLLNDKPKLEAFLNGPLIYRDVFQYGVNPTFPETFVISAKKGETVSFQFNKGNDKIVEQTKLYIKGPRAVDSIYPRLYRNGEGLYCIDHNFSEKGAHIVHILLDEHYAFTYNVNVK